MSGSSYPGTVTGGQKAVLFQPRAWMPNGAGKGILAQHGHGADALQFTAATDTIGDHASKLADAGFAVLAGDEAGGASWGGAAAMTAMDDLYAYLQTGPSKCRSGRVGLFGWSMGGLVALNWMKRNPTKVGCVWLWSPVTDLDWARTQAAWTAEVNAAYGGDYSTSGGYRVHDEPASFRGIAPIRIAHATDDAVVPFAQSQAFVTAVNDPEVSLHSTSLVGGHTDLFRHVSASDISDFFAAHL